MQAFGAVAEAARGVGGFPAGLVLHSWAGHAEVTRQLAALPGVHFSLSGHTLRLAPRKLAPMLARVRVGFGAQLRVLLAAVGAHAAPGAAQAGAPCLPRFNAKNWLFAEQPRQGIHAVLCCKALAGR